MQSTAQFSTALMKNVWLLHAAQGNSITTGTHPEKIVRSKPKTSVVVKIVLSWT